MIRVLEAATSGGQIIYRVEFDDHRGQVRELEVPTAPQARVPSSHVVAGPDRLLSDLLTEDGLVGPDGLVPFISRALGRLHEAEEALGPAGSEVEEPSASNGRAVMASKGGPGGVMIELI